MPTLLCLRRFRAAPPGLRVAPPLLGASLAVLPLSAGCAQPSDTARGLFSEAGISPSTPEAGADVLGAPPDPGAAGQPGGGPDAGPDPQPDAGPMLPDEDAGGDDAAASVCGNGVMEPGEDCDGSDFGGKDCESVGLGAGTLLCNPYCGIIVSGCKDQEICNDGYDNDDDFDTDCADSDCAGTPYCTDSCFSPQTITSLPSWEYSDTDGRPSTLSPSCVTTSGPEAVYELTASASEELEFKVTGDAVALSVRSACADAQSELACANDDSSGFYETESFKLSVTKGETYFVIVDAEDDLGGYFDLSIDPPPKETYCTDFWDDDGDGLVDCDDPECQGDPGCKPGTKAVGEACTDNVDCAATGGDPVCLTGSQDYKGGYCSEFCAASGDCPGDAVCVDIGVSEHGVCLDGCSADGDCRADYVCLDRGAGKVCSPPAEVDCANLLDDDGDGDVDCRDSDCTGLPICKPGAGKLGDPCTKSSDCSAWAGDDPVCLTDGFQDGYCSEQCTAACDTDGECISFLPGGGNVCFAKCTADADCRDGYVCTKHSFFEQVCTP